MARISGKLTARTLGWDRTEIGSRTKNLPDNGRVNLGRVVGIVSGIHEQINDETGEVQTGLKGQFRGVSTLNVMKDTGKKDKDGAPIMADTGKPIEVTAGRCYLPSGLQDMIEGTYRSAVENDPKATVSFAIDLYAMKATNKAGYTFDGETLVEAEADDPLDGLMKLANETAQNMLTDQSEKK